MIVLRLPPVTHFRQRAIEWGITGILISYAVVLFQPADVFTQPQFLVLKQIAGVRVWAFVCAGIGLLRLAALWANGTWHPSPFVRAAAALLSGLFWLVITLGVFGSGRTATSLAIYPWFVVADLYSVYSATLDARTIWKQRAQGDAHAGARPRLA